jgi:membrane-associated protein
MQSAMLDALNGPIPYIVLAAGLLLGSFGLPVPTSLMATVAGTLAADGDLDPAATVSIALAACLAGDLLGYAVGRYLGPRVVRQNRWISVNPRWFASVEPSFVRRSGLVLVLTRSVLAIGASLVNLLAGATRQNVASFVVYDLLGRGLWVAMFVGAGYALAGSATGVAEADVLSGLSGPLGLAGIAVVFAMLQSPRLSPAPTKR